MTSDRVAFTTRKTLFSWELAGEARVTASGNGSRIGIVLDNAPGRPGALLDGKKNAKAAEKLADQIRAT